MNYEIEKNRIYYLLSQRNFLLGLSSVLLMIVLLQSVFLFLRNEKIIITPPELKESFWVEGNRFSKNYLEEMASFYAHLLLDVSPETLLYQGEIVLRSADPSSYSRLKLKLFQDHKKMKRENSTSHFHPQKAVIDTQNLQVQLEGLMNQYVSGKLVSSYQEKFVIRFSASKGKLFIKDFVLVDTKNQKFNEEVETNKDIQK